MTKFVEIDEEMTFTVQINKFMKTQTAGQVVAAEEQVRIMGHN
jgi:hypothetical protein